MTRSYERLLLALVIAGDRLLPKADEIVLRTGPDFDDQGREVLAALTRAAGPRITWLVDQAEARPPLPPGSRVARVRSIAGLWAYWRARVVLHTHGLFSSRRTSRRKTFVNLWHGMPIKRLEADSDVGRNQTDLTIATSDIHARHLAETWGLPRSRVAITGLPRNDRLVDRAAPTDPLERPASLRARCGDRPLVVWLPTFRRMADEDSIDGVDAGTDTQFAGATAEAVDAACERLGVHAILKVHPLAPRPDRTDLEHLEVWGERELGDAGLTLYQLLAQADVLISDHSSVWIDFLLTQRPVVFAVSDLEQYRDSRGFYFDPIEDLFPGPLVTRFDQLEEVLGRILAGDDAWVDRRRRALELHHAHVDGASADRVAALVLGLRGEPGRGGLA